MKDISLTVPDILGQHGLLSRSLEGFEFRDSQIQMAFLIQEALEQRAPAIIEAGTGTGKTFGYLAPVILSEKKAVVSTGTKNLQEQIFYKDIPLLQKATGITIDATIMKGRNNYLCLQRYHQYFSQRSFLKADKGMIKEELDTWIQKTEFADRAELSWLADDDAFWDLICSTSDQCLGASCMFLDDCFLSRLRSKAAKSKIIIVNHHLFFADMKVKKGGFGEIIPRFQVVVFDEAHNIEEIATSYFGESLSTWQLTELVNDLGKGVTEFKEIDKIRLEKHLIGIKTACEQLRTFFNGYEDKGRLDNEGLSGISEGPARDINRGLRYIQEKAGFRETGHVALHSIVGRAEELYHLLEQILRKRDTNWLHWYEKRKKSVVLHASPLDVSERMNELLYKKVQTVVLTSATISTNKNFDYIRSRLGLSEETLDGIYPSHFDFRTQTLMYIPRDLPPPNDVSFGSSVGNRVRDIIKGTAGRALVLFTSHYNMNLVHQILNGRVPYAIYKQGDAPRSVLLEAFRRDIHSVLLATGSFWQGVDVPGEALSCLIIDKLPFDSPGEPLVAARIDAILDKGGNPFMDYQVPSAIISLKQGLGRLIRKSSDRGLLSVLDTRIMTSRYGRFFLDSLPEIPISHELSDISKFFRQ